MTPEAMENAIQFLIEAQGKFLTDIESLKDRQAKTDAQIQSLTTSLQILAENAEAQRLELRDAFDKLILTNEVTRELTVQIGNLVVQTSQRVSRLEEQNGKA